MLKVHHLTVVHSRHSDKDHVSTLCLCLSVFLSVWLNCLFICLFGRSVFYVVVRWHKLVEVENKSTFHNSIVLAIFVPKTIKSWWKLNKVIRKTSLTGFFWNTVYFGDSRSFKVIDVDKSKKPIVSFWLYVPVCNRFHTRWANIGKIAFFRGGTPLWCPCSRRTPSPKGTKFCHEKLESLSQPTVKISWFWLTLFWLGSRVWRTDRRTDTSMMAKTHEALHAVACKNPLRWSSRQTLVFLYPDCCHCLWLLWTDGCV